MGVRGLGVGRECQRNFLRIEISGGKISENSGNVD